MVARDATRPRLTWYDADGSRVELSAKVLAMWVSKAANLLTEEGDVGPGDTVVLLLPPAHWRAAYWALATWSVGATLSVSPDPAAAALITTDPLLAAEDSAPLRVVVTEAALARRYDGALPLGVVDEAAELALYGDRFDPPRTPAPADVALVSDRETWTYTDVVPAPNGVGRAPRQHLDGSTATVTWLREALAAWAAGGSVVVTYDGGDPDARRRILAAEGVTA